MLTLLLLQPDGSAWRADASVAERTLLGLAVADCGLALVNGALPRSFDPLHTPSSWWMEAIFKVREDSIHGVGVEFQIPCSRTKSCEKTFECKG